MKLANWEQCSEISIGAQILNLKEIETNLLDFPVPPGDVLTAAKIAVAVSFIRQAKDTLSQTRSDANPNG